jgi:ribonuclease P protein component
LLSDYNAALESTMARLAARGRPRAAANGSAGTTQEGTPRA